MFHFRREAQAAEVHRPGHARPRGRLLGDHHDARRPLVAGGVDLLQERDRVQVLPAAEHVRRPLARLARVVQVQHRGDGVHPQPVDVELLQPVHRVGDQEVAHLAAAEVEDERAPVGMLAAARVGVLVQLRAVEPGQRPGVLREVGGHPVDDHADAGLMQPVDQVAEVVRRPEPGRRRVIRRHLVAPRSAERVLGDRHELDVGEPAFGHILNKGLGELGVGQPGPPRADVDLVDAHRLAQRIALGAGGHPVLVGPVEAGLEHHRGGGRRDLGEGRHRIGLAVPAAVRAADLVLVRGTASHARHEQLPDAGAAERAHRVRPAVPVVEVADQPDAAGARCPDGERGPVQLRPDPGAEHLPELLVPALADQVQVHLAERGQVPVRVVDEQLGPVGRVP